MFESNEGMWRTSIGLAVSPHLARACTRLASSAEPGGLSLCISRDRNGSLQGAKELPDFPPFPSAESGDTFGCGLLLREAVVFFTRNGSLIGNAFSIKDCPLP